MKRTTLAESSCCEAIEDFSGALSSRSYENKS